MQLFGTKLSSKVKAMHSNRTSLGDAGSLSRGIVSWVSVFHLVKNHGVFEARVHMTQMDLPQGERHLRMLKKCT